MRVTAHNANGARILEWQVNHAPTLAAQMFGHDVEAITGFAVDGVGIFTVKTDDRGRLTGFTYLDGREFKTVTNKAALANILA